MSESPRDDDALREARDAIDELDQQIQSLINQRAGWAVRVAEVKQRAGRTDFYRPEREAQVLDRVARRNAGPLSDAAMTRIVREIMSACLALEQPLTVAYLGPEGTYTQAAVYKHFGHAVNARPSPAINDIFREVEAGNAHFGVVPVENSTEGVVSHTLDQLVSSPLSICGEVALPVHHHLLSHETDPSAIKRVVAHAQSLAQCRNWLDSHMPGVVREAVSSNGEAARRVAGETGAAAIAARAASAFYDLPILASNIEDDPNNTTRFLVLGNQAVAPSGHDMTSILVSIRNQPGMLYRLLAPAARAGVDLARIESRPSRRQAWDYNFFIDMQGHVDDAPVRAVIEAIRGEAALIKVLGSYPCSVGREAEQPDD
ncbi:prephenate dehydratase [Salinisphaera sp. Q1T1-3]|uniref:prephenate dehydratase n=1 Tax=Salinisphaera sp. Q1T1-3 TaxID=2321229 RepID=UPI000E746173|nr:prephenate dehydratase [Salinisphaera sp. Q1T1-3]RJS92763.1 prephenate dehydratase [Salinisphaera sp. Q1T1-3]